MKLRSELKPIPASHISTVALALSAVACCGLFTPACDDSGGASEPEEPHTLIQALEEIADEMGLSEDGSLGQMDDSDEAPAFGSLDLDEAFPSDEAEDPPVEESEEWSDPEVILEGRHVVSVLVAWGRVRPLDRSAESLDWNPTFRVRESDFMRVRRTIRFEAGDEAMTDPDLHGVEVISSTGSDIDGVALQIAVETATADDAAVTIEFLAHPDLPTVDIPLATRREYSRLIDEAGNGVVVITRPKTGPESCPSGFMRGVISTTSDTYGADAGVFGGEWRRDDGRLLGHVAGRFGTDEAGVTRFHGKVINLDGEFLGIVGGSGAGGEYVPGEKYYSGTLSNPRGTERGDFFVRSYIPPGETEGTFEGSWSIDCADQPD